jgi:RHS repeat-associated protein
MKLGTLQTITYPTGGNTAFEYEANDYYNPIGIKALNPVGNLPHFWDGGNCGTNNTSTNTLLKTFTLAELDNMFYKLEDKKAAYYTATCNDAPPTYKINVYIGSTSTSLYCTSGILTASSTVIAGTTNPIQYQTMTKMGKLTSLFPCLQANFTYRFEIVGTNCAANFTLQQEVTIGTITNRKVGGLRVKKITTNDAINAANNIVKTYDYNADNTSPAQSSAVLYSKPSYSAVYDPLVVAYGVDGIEKPNTYRFHVFTDYSIVPLSSFEGATVGYSTVKEYSSNGAYTKYTYFQEPIQSYVGTPVPPTFPRVDAGNLSTKLQVNSNGTTVASETNTVYTTDVYTPRFAAFSSNPDRYFKAIKHTLVNEGLTTFFSEYTIPNKPYRLGSMTSTVDGVTTTTNYTYDTGTRAVLPKRSETVTNSNGMATTSTYYYANDSTIIANNANNPALISRNMIGFPIKVKQQTGTSVKWTKVEYALFNSTQIEPQYLKECFNADESVATNWITRLQVSAYTTSGMPSTIYKNSFLAPETYTWDPTYPKLLKKKQFGYLSSTTSLLTWDILYKTGTSLVEKMIDENRLVKRYAYDPLMRLDSIKDRMKEDETNIQAITKYDYHYKNSPTDYNYVGTSTTFVNAGNTTPLSTKQYMDGLVRPLSTVRENYTPNLLSQKNNVTYDALGRQDKSYNPFEGGLGYEAATTAPFTYATYEASPLSRPIRQYTEDGRFIETRYGTNTANEVQRFNATTNGDGTNIISLGTPSLYDAGTLFKTIVLNENWNGSSDDYIGRTEIFKDKLGRVLLSRKFLKDANNVYQNVDTYNVYDNYSNLVMVIPPGAFVPADATPIKLTLVFEYNYDYRNRLIKKKVPSAEAVNFYYDARDLLTLTQDGNMRTPTYGGNANKYLGTQYNEIGQVVKTGWVYTTAPLSAALTVAILDTNKLTETQYYDNRTWVKNQGAKVLKRSGLQTARDFMWSYIERRTGYEYTGNPIWTGKQHLLSQTYFNGTTVVGDAPITDNDYGGVNWTVSGYDGAQKPTLTLNYLYSGASSTHTQEVRQWQTFTYDNGQRLKSSNYTYALFGASVSSPTAKLSDMTYNFKDQVIEKNTAFVNNKYLQSTDYEYNNRGWLTAINSGFLNASLNYPLFSSSTSSSILTNYASLGITGYLTPPAQSNESNPDLFKELIGYDNLNTGFPATLQFNGNISQIEWQVAGREAQTYSLSYDNLERLTSASYADNHGTDWSSKGWSSQYSIDSKFNENATYDLRGNITALNRNGWTTGVMVPVSTPYYNTALLTGVFTTVDQLAYTYANNKNKLIKVTDAPANLGHGFLSVSAAANAGTTHYAYDDNGNLIRDDNKGITNITYNYLNLPMVITFTNIASGQPRRIEFIYDATGVKLRKTIYLNDAVTDMRHYVNGIEYMGSGGVLDRFAHTEGAVILNENGVYEHEYVIKDHLGNTHVTYRDGINKVDNTGNTTYNDGTITVADIKQINSYYPFGLNMEGNFNGVDGNNKYQFGGKEWNADFGLNWNDYGKRWYDPSLGKWSNIDPKSEKYYSFTPYNYVLNNPINKTDPNGDTVRVYTELVAATGYTTRHSFMRVTTDKVDVIIELWGPNASETVRATGRPHIDKYDSGKMNRTWVTEHTVTRPKDSPEGNYKFENKILKDAAFFSKQTVDSKTGKIDYPNVPEYKATGPNSNGYVNFLIQHAGGQVDLPWNAARDGSTSSYQSILGDKNRAAIEQTIEYGKKVIEEAKRQIQNSNNQLEKN